MYIGEFDGHGLYTALKL